MNNGRYFRKTLQNWGLIGVICGLSLLLVHYSAPRFFTGYSGFPLSSETNISKFQFQIWIYRQALYHEPLARVIAQALPVFDVKFTFYIYINTTRRTKF